MPSRLECGRPSNRGTGVRHAVVGVQIDLLVLHRPPKALDEDVVPPGAFAVHADRDAMAGEHAGEGRARELAALIGVEDLAGPGGTLTPTESAIFLRRTPTAEMALPRLGAPNGVQSPPKHMFPLFFIVAGSRAIAELIVACRFYRPKGIRL